MLFKRSFNDKIVILNSLHQKISYHKQLWKPKVQYLTNKYAEGYPGRRYYGGCEHVDVTESIAIERAKALFGAEHVNVQPHSGSQANMAVYLVALEMGDTVLGMNLSHGGHLTHGATVNLVVNLSFC